LALGIEKNFVEKHPATVTNLAFYEDKVLISGSVDGRVNLIDLDAVGSKAYKCQNVQDRKIPIGKIVTSDYGIGAVVDIEGNCRFYDLIRLRKMSKISCKTGSVKGDPTWRMFPDPAICSNSEALLGVIQGSNSGSIVFEKSKPDEPEAAAKPSKDAKGAMVTPDIDITDPRDIDYLTEKDLLVPRRYSDNKESLRTLDQISRETSELPFILQKSSICIYRFEDVIFGIYPHLAAYRRRGTSSKEVFHQIDPMAKKKSQEAEAMSGLAGALAGNATGETFNKNMVRSGGLNKSNTSFEKSS